MQWRSNQRGPKRVVATRQGETVSRCGKNISASLSLLSSAQDPSFAAGLEQLLIFGATIQL